MEPVAPGPALIEAISWRLAAEMLRLSPGGLSIIETHPGGGQYDCLRLQTPEDDWTGVEMNRAGSIHVNPKRESQSLPDAWARVASGVCSAVEMAELLSHLSGLPRQVPDGDHPAAVFATLVADVLAIFALDPVRWECRMAWEDTSGYGGGMRNEWVSAFDVAIPEPGGTHDQLYLEEAYQHWVIVRGDEPLVMLNTHVVAFPRTGGPVDLTGLASRGERLRFVLDLAEGVVKANS